MLFNLVFSVSHRPSHRSLRFIIIRWFCIWIVLDFQFRPSSWKVFLSEESSQVSVVVRHFTLESVAVHYRPLFFTIIHWFSLFFSSSSLYPFAISSASVAVGLGKDYRLCWDWGDCHFISATVVNTTLSTINFKVLSNYMVYCLGGLSQCCSVPLNDCPQYSSMVLNDCPECRSMLNDCRLYWCVVQPVERMSVMLDDHRIKWIVLLLCHCTGVPLSCCQCLIFFHQDDMNCVELSEEELNHHQRLHWDMNYYPDCSKVVRDMQGLPKLCKSYF